MATLYELTNDRKALYDLIGDLTDPETGETRELTVEEMEALAALDNETGDAVDSKIDSICKVYKTINAQAEVAQVERATFRDEMSRLSRTATARENEAKRVKNLISYFFDKLGKKKHKTPLFNVYTQATRKTARPDIFYDVDKIPVEYLKRELSASAIDSAIKEGRLYEKTSPLDKGRLFFIDELGIEQSLVGVSYLGGETLVIR